MTDISIAESATAPVVPNTSAILEAAAAQTARVTASMEKAKKTNPLHERAKAANFNPQMVASYRNPQTKVERACWKQPDGTVLVDSQVEIELPPFMLARGSKIFGEGDAFKEVKGKDKKVEVDRAQAHFRPVFIFDISAEMRELYPEWGPMQEKTVADVRTASLKLIEDTFDWKDSEAWSIPIKRAKENALPAFSFPGKDALKNDAAQLMAIEKDPALKAAFTAVAMKKYLDKSRYGFQERVDETTQKPLPTVIVAETKVYGSKKYDPDIHNNKAEGPPKADLPSNNENMAKVAAKMATLVGKGGKGVDVRVYQPLKFVNCMPPRKLTPAEEKIEKKRKRTPNDPSLPPKKPDPFADRPYVRLENGDVVPNYWWNPTAFEGGIAEEGKPIQSYATATLGFVLTCSENGGYGVKYILKNARKICIQDYEDTAERENTVYGKRSHGAEADGVVPSNDEDDDDDNNADENARKQQEAEEAAARVAAAALANGGEPNGKRQRTESGSATAATADKPATYGDDEIDI